MITHLLNREAFEGREAEIEGDAYRHLFRSRRLAVGERLRVTDGGGRARWAEIGDIDRRRGILVLGEPAPSNEPEYRLDLIVAALRPERASWLVEKATELGAAAVRFLASERTPRRYGDAKLERWRRVAAAAVEQCHRALVPEVSGVHGWEELPVLLDGREERWVLDPGGDPREPGARAAGSGVAVIGPEGGWSHDERAELQRHGVRAMALGPRVLRVETAAVVATARILLPPCG